MEPKALAALSMEGGKYAAVEGLDPAIADWITRAVEAMAGGGGVEAPSERGEQLAGRDQDKPEPDAGQYREDNQDGMMRGKGRKPSAMELELGRARKAADQAAKITIRARVKELRAEGVNIDTAAAEELEKLADIDAAEERIKWLTRGRETAKARGNSGAIVDNTQGDEPAYKIDDLVSEGFNVSFAKHISDLSRTDKAGAKESLEFGRARKAQQKNGGL